MNDNYQPPPRLLDSLAPEQFAAANHLAKDGRGIIWHKVGEGKTRTALAWMFYMTGKPRPLIICSPGAFRQWQDEIELLKLAKLIKPRYLSYGMLSQKKPVVVPFDKVNCLVIDELWLYKNHKSHRSLMLRQISHRMPTIGLSGSMVTARNIEDLYGQACAVHLGEKVARNITAFRKEFCIELANPYTKFLERYPKKGAVTAIQGRLAGNIHVYFPKETREIRNIPTVVMPALAQVKIKQKLVKEYYYEHQGKYGFQLEIKSAGGLLVKLQQVSDGFLRDGEGHSLLIPSNKLLRLKELCAELLDAGERLLIWVAFRQTAKRIREALSVPVLLLTGEHPFDAKAWHRREANICVATVGSGASLNDFASVRYALFYSTRFSHLQVQQAKGRTNRKSDQLGPRYYYYLQTDTFPDRYVYEMIEKSYSTEEFVIMATNQVLANTLDKEEV